MVFAQSAGRAGVDHLSPPPLSSGLAWTYAICFTYTTPYRTMRVPFVCSDIIFLLQVEETIRGDALLGLSFSILCSLSCTPTRYCFIFVSHPCWLDRTIMRA